MGESESEKERKSEKERVIACAFVYACERKRE